MQSGIIPKNDQIDKLNEILTNLEKNEDFKYEVKNQIMGGGKTSVLTPLLVLMYYIEKNNIFIVIPPHQINQTKLILIKNVIPILKRKTKIFILDDNNVKNFSKLI